MKTRLRLIVTLLMAIAMGAQVKAENYGVYIAGKQITSSNYSKLADIDGVYVSTGGRIYFDSSSNTLYLRNVNINKKDEIGLKNESCSGLKVVFEEYYDSDGINTGCWIQSTNKQAVLLKCSTTFTSTGVGHGVFNSYKSADLSIENYSGYAYIRNTDISMQGSNIGINGNSTGKLSIWNSVVKVWGGNNVPAVQNLAELKITGTSVVNFVGNNSTQTVSGVSSFSIDEDMAISSPTGASFSSGTFKKSGSAITGDIEIKTTAIRVNSTNFPDGNFRSYVSSKFDSDGDGYLIKKEIRNATFIEVSSKSISNLKGIEHLTNLGSLICMNNNLSSIDVSKNTSLASFYCDNNKLTSLNVTNNKELLYLTCSGNENLSSLNLTNNTQLTKLDCTGNKSLTSLNLSYNSALEELVCKNCTKLTSITMGTHNSLKKVDFSSDNFSSDTNINYSLNHYIVGKLPTMSGGVFNTSLWISKTDVNKATTKGWSLSTNGVEAYELNSTNFPDANFRSFLSSSDYLHLGWVLVERPTELNVEGKGIKDLTGIRLFTNLQKLYCGNNQLTTLDVSKNTKLFYLGCQNNTISSLNITGCTNFYTLNCRNNNLSTLNVSPATNLQNLYCDDNNLSSLTVSSNSSLTNLYCSNNRLSSLSVSSNNNLTTLDCSYNQLTSLTLPKNNTKLTTIHCEGNKLKGSNMTNTVNSLPTVSSGNLYVSTSTSSEGNELTKEQLANAQRKNWNVWQKAASGSGWEYYVVGGITTDLNTIVNGDLNIEYDAEGWYTIDGKKLNGKPNAKGVYIHNGKAVVN